MFVVLISLTILIFNKSISDSETKSTEKRKFSNRINHDDNISKDTIGTSTTNRSRKMPRKHNQRVSVLK